MTLDQGIGLLRKSTSKRDSEVFLEQLRDYFEQE
jgi:hypothetical protein